VVALRSCRLDSGADDGNVPVVRRLHDTTSAASPARRTGCSKTCTRGSKLKPVSFRLQSYDLVVLYKSIIITLLKHVQFHQLEIGT